jgi:hypothetical protein
LGKHIFDLFHEGRKEKFVEHVGNDHLTEDIPYFSVRVVTQIVIVLDYLQINLVPLTDSFIIRCNFPLKLKLNLDMSQFLGLFGKNPHISLESRHRLFFDSFDWVELRVKIDVFVALRSRNGRNHQSLVVLFSQNLSQFWVGEQFLTDVLVKSLESFFDSKQRETRLVSFGICSSQYAFELIFRLASGRPGLLFLVAFDDIVAKHLRANADLRVLKFLNDASFSHLSHQLRTMRGLLLKVSIDLVLSPHEFLVIVEISQFSRITEFVNHLLEFKGHIRERRQKSLYDGNHLLLFFSERMPFLIELLNSP